MSFRYRLELFLTNSSEIAQSLAGTFKYYADGAEPQPNWRQLHFLWCVPVGCPQEGIDSHLLSLLPFSLLSLSFSLFQIEKNNFTYILYFFYQLKCFFK